MSAGSAYCAVLCCAQCVFMRARAHMCVLARVCAYALRQSCVSAGACGCVHGRVPPGCRLADFDAASSAAVSSARPTAQSMSLPCTLFVTTSRLPVSTRPGRFLSNGVCVDGNRALFRDAASRAD